MNHTFGEQLKQSSGIFDHAPFAKMALIITGKEAAKLARVKNPRAFARWALDRPKVRVGRDRYSMPAVVRELEKEALQIKRKPGHDSGPSKIKTSISCRSWGKPAFFQ